MPVVLITGASSGIGEALALEYAARGDSLALLARRADRLQSVAARAQARGARVFLRTCDVTDELALREAADAAARELGGLDIVYANAGVGVSGRFDTLSLDDYRRQFETNVFGVIRTIQATIGELRRARGRLVILGSVAGHVAAPGMSPYAMSKFAVRALAESLRAEFRASGVSVTLISPGFVDSEIRRVGRDGVFRPDNPELVPAWLRVQTDVAVRHMVKAVDRRKAEAVITGHGKLLVFFARHTPGTLRLLTNAIAPKVRKV